MTTYRDEPEVQWTDMSDATWQAENTAWSPGWCAAMTRNQIYLKHLLYGEGTYTGDVPHTHIGAEDAHAATTNGANILGASCPAGNSIDPRGVYNEWTAKGFSDQDGESYVQGGIKGDYLFQYLFFPQNNIQYVPRVVGKGLDLTVSFFAKQRDNSDFGKIEFGIASSQEGATSAASEAGDVIVSSPGDFLNGQRAIISGADLSTSWKRFYCTIREAGAGAASGARLLLRVSETFDHEVLLTGFAATQGRRLYPWAPSPCDEPYTGDSNDFIGGHAGWQNMPQGAPILDWTVSMTNAVRLEAY